MRKNIYKWHRTLSLIIALPVLLWAISGFMHPIMTNIRPSVASQFYTAPAIDTSQINTSLQQTLTLNRIDSFSNVRIVQMGGQQFYQVMIDNSNTDIRYFSTKTGNLLKNGDDLYARFLAKQFLEGSGKKDSAAASEEPMAMSDHDCCIMATASIMNSNGAKITNIEKVTTFTAEYKYINRLLPAHKVSFDRNDGIRIYVETADSRFAFAMDNKRAVFDKIFGTFHTWEWMNGLGNTKYFIMVLICLLGISTTLMGLYIFFTTKTKKSDNPLVKSRRNHRYTSLLASLFTLLFTFSGGYHALDKVLPKETVADHLNNSFASADANLDITQLLTATGNKPVQNISIVRVKDKRYWQVYIKADKASQDNRTDLMKNKPAKQSPVVYINADDYTVLENGEQEYAKHLASSFSNNNSNKIKSAEFITKFAGEYGFVNKRLPVWKVSYAANDNERYYVETSTGVLAVKVQDKDLAEGYSFSFLHKHHFMDWAGKSVRDFSTMFWAAMQVAMILVGLFLWRRAVKRKSA